MGANVNVGHRQPWNKGKIVGQKAPVKLKDMWALRVRLQMATRRIQASGPVFLALTRPSRVARLRSGHSRAADCVESCPVTMSGRPLTFGADFGCDRVCTVDRTLRLTADTGLPSSRRVAIDRLQGASVGRLEKRHGLLWVACVSSAQ